MREPLLRLGPDLVKLVADIDEFKGRWESLAQLSPGRLDVLRRDAKIQSVGSSTRLEGSQLLDPQIETMLFGLAIKSFKTRDGQQAAGYAQAIDLVCGSFRDLLLTEDQIRQLHQVLLRHSDRDPRHGGAYKTLPHHVMAVDTAGRQIGILSSTASPSATPREMQQLVAWTQKATAEQALHPLLIAAVFTVKLLAIHPFQHGNGALARVLTSLLLLQAGYAYVPFASLERVIEENRELYYRALRRTQATLDEETPDWEPWIGCFLRCLKQQKDQLAVRMQRERAACAVEDELPDLSRQVLAAVRAQQRSTIGQLVATTGANRNTLKLRLRELVQAERLRQHGKARATWYSISAG